MISSSAIAKTVTTAFPWIITGVGWIVALFQWRKKRKAEAELKLIRRRGDAPFFTPPAFTVDRLFTDASEGEARTAAAATVLTAFHAEVPKDMPADTPVRFVVDNQGQPARRVSVSLDGKLIQLRSEPALKFASGLQFLEYPYDPTKHGQDQRLVVSFETASGCRTATRIPSSTASGTWSARTRLNQRLLHTHPNEQPPKTDAGINRCPEL
jgi:hypothetical protein